MVIGERYCVLLFTLNDLAESQDLTKAQCFPLRHTFGQLLLGLFDRLLHLPDKLLPDTKLKVLAHLLALISLLLRFFLPFEGFYGALSCVEHFQWTLLSPLF